MFAIGVDPDLHTTAIAVLRCDLPVPVIFNAIIVRTPEKHKGRDAAREMTKELSTVFDAIERNIGESLVVGFAVEHQEIAYTAKAGGNPRDVMMLGPVSGAALLALYALWPNCEAFLPSPSEWKGQVPKDIHQGRTLTRLGLKYERAGIKPGQCRVKENGRKREGWCYPVNPETCVPGVIVKKADWKHLSDAAGLALWAWDEATKARRRAAALASTAPRVSVPAELPPGRSSRTAARRKPAAPCRP